MLLVITFRLVNRVDSPAHACLWHMSWRPRRLQEGELTLLVAANKAGYFGVRLDSSKPGLPKPYQARVGRGGEQRYLGSFATAEEAALCVARTPEEQAVAAERAAAAPPLTSEKERQEAQAEKLTLRVADNSSGYFGVYLAKPGLSKPYKAQVRRGGQMVHLGSFATAEEAALCVARSPEGPPAPAAAAESQGTLPAVPSGATSLKEEDTVPPMPPGTFVKEEVVVPSMPPDAFVKVEVVVKEEEGSTDGRPKWQRAK